MFSLRRNTKELSLSFSVGTMRPSRAVFSSIWWRTALNRPFLIMSSCSMFSSRCLSRTIEPAPGLQLASVPQHGALWLDGRQAGTCPTGQSQPVILWGDCLKTFEYKRYLKKWMNDCKLERLWPKKIQSGGQSVAVERITHRDTDQAVNHSCVSSYPAIVAPRSQT